MGGRTIITYLITTLTAVIGLVLVNVIEPGKSISVETQNDY